MSNNVILEIGTSEHFHFIVLHGILTKKKKRVEQYIGIFFSETSRGQSGKMCNC